MNEEWVEKYWRTAKSYNPSIKMCVYVYVVPKGKPWHETTKLNKCRTWLEGATD